MSHLGAPLCLRQQQEAERLRLRYAARVITGVALLHNTGKESQEHYTYAAGLGMTNMCRLQGCLATWIGCMQERGAERGSLGTRAKIHLQPVMAVVL